MKKRKKSVDFSLGKKEKVKVNPKAAGRRIINTALIVFAAIVLGYGLITFCVQTVYMTGSSMESVISDGDELILFSDGVIDIQNEKEEYYGRERLLDAVKLNIGKSAAEQVSFIANNIYSFCGSREQNDDLTIIVLKK